MAFSRVLQRRYLRLTGFLAAIFIRAFLQRARKSLDLTNAQVHLSPATLCNGRFSSLLLPASTGRLGNGLVQLGSIMTYVKLRGQEVGGAVIVNSEFPLIKEGLHTVDGLTVLVADIHSQNTETSSIALLKGPLLQADWFYSSHLVNSGDISEGLRISRSLLRDEYLVGLPDSEDLAIHYRVSDIFGQSPHAAYGPPPHAFFELIVQSLKPRKIRVVAEDFSDDLVSSLMARLAGYSEVVGERRVLEEDVRNLLSASHLALSVGTFGLTISGLSNRLQVLYQFEGLAPITVQREKLSTVRDVSGGYVDKIQKMNWQNTVEQRELVTSYPLEALRLEPPLLG